MAPVHHRSGPILPLLLGAATALFGLLALLVSDPAATLTAFDRWVSDAALSFAQAHPAWVTAMKWVTTTGGLGLLGPVVAGLGLVLLARGRRGDALFVWGAMLFTILSRNVVVDLIGRARPDDRLVQISSFSFPSGHTTASASVAALLILVFAPLLRRRWSRTLLTVLAVGWAPLAVGVSESR